MIETNRAIAIFSFVLFIAVGAIVAPLVVGAESGTDDGDHDLSEGQLASSSYTPPDRGEPDLSVGLPDNEVTPGTTNELAFEIRNDGDIRTGSGNGVTDAQSVIVAIDDDGPFDARFDAVAIGPVQDGGVTEAIQSVDVPDDIEPGEYDVSVEVSYTYAATISTDGSVDRERNTETHTVTVVVPDEPRFEISDVKTDVEPGASGPAQIEITNTGTEPANDTRTELVGGSGVTIDGGSVEAPAEELIGDLNPGESTTIAVDVAIDGAVSSGEKPIEVTFSYRDGSGIQQDGGSETASLVPGAEQSFSIGNVADTLSVGDDGDITGEITNDGPRTIDDAVLIVEPMSESLFTEDTRYALPALDPGETTEFRYPTDVSGQADPGPRQLRFSVEYTGSGGDATLDDGPFTERVVVDERTDEFSLADDGIVADQGDRTDFVLEITNERDQTLSNIDARLYADSPLDTSNDEAFVPELAPGESAELSFDVAAAEDATPELHPVELDFEYETERGETVVSDVYQHPIEVQHVEDDDGGAISGTLVGVMAALTALGLGIGMWWRRT